MKTRDMLPLMIIMLLLFMFVQCGENIFQTNEKTTPPQTELAKKGNGGGGGGGGGGGNDSKRGDDFGDLYILWRNADGAPIYIEIESEEHDTELKTQPIGFEGTWVSDGEKWVGVPNLDDSPDFNGEYFFKEGFDYDFWDGFYNIGEFGLDAGWDAYLGESDMVVPYNADGDLNPDQDFVPAGVEIGRKNLARAPQNVLNRALDEALKTLTFDDSPLTIDYCGRLVGKIVDNDGEIVPKTIDSPRENMALYQSIMKNEGFGGLGEAASKLSDLVDPEGTRGIRSYLDIAASCFAAASDKSDNLYVDEIVYCNTFLGINGEADNRFYDHYTEFPFYSRDRYDTRWLRVTILDGEGSYEEVDMTISDAAEVGYFKFTEKYWGESNLAGFRTAADDAIQVLDYIHGDSNMEWLGFRDGNTDPFEK